MKVFSRAFLAAAVVAIAVVQWRPRVPTGRPATIEAVAPCTTSEVARATTGMGSHASGALIFSRTAAFRHTECIPQGTVAIAQMGVRENFHVDATENPALFTDADLANYDVVIFLCTTGDVLTPISRRHRALHPGRQWLCRHSLCLRYRVRLGVVRRTRRATSVTTPACPVSTPSSRWPR